MSSSHQKGSAITGGLVSDEFFASSDSVLQAGSYGHGFKGGQQFFSPEPMAKLAHAVIGSRVAVLDPTAGDGSLLKFFDKPYSYGVEMDPDQIKNSDGSYNAIRGDIQHVYTLLRTTLPSWDAIVANPPFGFQWKDDSYRNGKPTNSTLLTFIYASRLLAENGQLVFICGRDRFYRQIEQLEEAKGIYAVVEIEDAAFENVTLPTVMAFGINPGNRAASSEGYRERQVSMDMLDLLGPWVLEQREWALGDYNSVSRSSYGSYTLPDQFTTIQKEHDRRLEGRVKKNREYDALLVGGKVIQWLPSGFAQLALATAGEAYAFHGLNGQNINYFSTNERLWNKLLSFQDQGILTVEPKLITAVEGTMGAIRKERVPLYAVKPQQRLGFLVDIEYLRCKKDDKEKGFLKGDNYRLDTRTQTIIEREERVVESKKTPGEYSTKTFEKQKKAMKVTVGHHSFLDGGKEASENIRWLIDHFELPDPGDVASRHPEEIAALEAIAQEILDEFEANSREWEKDNPTAMPYKPMPFQKQDVARLAFKNGGLLSWEQGLGKMLGGLLFMRMAWALGAKKVGLVVVPNDLIDQWCRESKRFLGYEPTRIEGKPTFYWEVDAKGVWSKKKYNGYHGQAREIQQHVKNGGEGFWITHYEGMCINGTRGKNAMLPTVTVREWEERQLIRGTDRYNRYTWVNEADGSLVASNDAKLKEWAASNNPTLWNLIDSTPSYELSRKLKDDYQIVQEPQKEYYAADGSPSGYGYILGRYKTVTKRLTSRDLCPECEADTDNGWNGVYCESESPNGEKCGYAHYAVRMKPIASMLSTTFQQGVIMLDEITKMQGDFSKTSKALRGLRASWWLGLTGTPIKNYIDQAFWLLWRVLGNGSTRFPFTYDGGKTRFENDFAVIEYMKNGNRRENRKLLPEVTNLSMLWRLLASSSIRRRKEETGEPLVPKYYHEIKVPMGMSQSEQYASWLKNFPKLFAEKYPESKVVKAGMHEIMAPMLGLNWKLQYACAMPEADPDFEWTGVMGVSNFTPANLKTLELAMALAKQGRKVLLGSVLKDAGKWYADRLNEKGVKALHILDDNGNTTKASNRAKIVYAFQTDKAQVFCAGVKAIRLGHNLDKADAVILNGLDFDYETLDQFVARIHRLTSQNPVDVFVVLPTLEGQKTITTRIWELLDMKGASAELALDGRLIEKAEQEISQADMIRELMERGFNVTDEAVDEVSVQEAWEAMPEVSEWDSEGIIPHRPTDDEDWKATPEGCAAAQVVGDFLIAHSGEDVQVGLDFGAPAVVADELLLEANADEFDAIDASEAELLAAEQTLLEALAPKIGPLMEDGSFVTATVTREELEEAKENLAEFIEDLAPTLEEVEAAVEAETIEPLPTQLDYDKQSGEGPWDHFVIVGPTDDEDGPLYWSNEDGWGFRSTATVFNRDEWHLRDPFETTGREQADAAVKAETITVGELLEQDTVKIQLAERPVEVVPEEATQVADVTKVADLPSAPISIAAEIRELKALLDEGILDTDEFKDAKTVLLARLKGGA